MPSIEIACIGLTTPLRPPPTSFTVDSPHPKRRSPRCHAAKRYTGKPSSRTKPAKRAECTGRDLNPHIIHFSNMTFHVVACHGRFCADAGRMASVEAEAIAEVTKCSDGVNSAGGS